MILPFVWRINIGKESNADPFCLYRFSTEKLQLSELEMWSKIDFYRNNWCVFIFLNQSDDFAYEISAKELRAWKNNYGALKGNEELIPVKNQITFSWCEINAYGQEPADPNQNKVISLLKKQEVGMKHILKNGKHNAGIISFFRGKSRFLWLNFSYCYFFNSQTLFEEVSAKFLIMCYGSGTTESYNVLDESCQIWNINLFKAYKKIFIKMKTV